MRLPGLQCNAVHLTEKTRIIIKFLFIIFFSLTPFSFFSLCLSHRCDAQPGGPSLVEGLNRRPVALFRFRREMKNVIAGQKG